MENKLEKVIEDTFELMYNDMRDRVIESVIGHPPSSLQRSLYFLSNLESIKDKHMSLIIDHLNKETPRMWGYGGIQGDIKFSSGDYKIEPTGDGFWIVYRSGYVGAMVDKDPVSAFLRYMNEY